MNGNEKCIRCEEAAKARGYCMKHWFEAQRDGTFRIEVSDEEIATRLAKRSHGEPSGCRVWDGALAKGYGKILLHGRFKGAHRVAYELERGPIPEGLVIDHLCRNPRCINPDHMEVVTHKENTLRGMSGHAVNARKTHCIRGHEFTEENTHVDYRGYRICRACKRQAQRKRTAAIKAARAA